MEWMGSMWSIIHLYSSMLQSPSTQCLIFSLCKSKKASAASKQPFFPHHWNCSGLTATIAVSFRMEYSNALLIRSSLSTTQSNYNTSSYYVLPLRTGKVSWQRSTSHLSIVTALTVSISIPAKKRIVAKPSAISQVYLPISPLKEAIPKGVQSLPSVASSSTSSTLVALPINTWIIYPSSYKHGSEKWVPPIVLTFQIYTFSTSMITPITKIFVQKTVSKLWNFPYKPWANLDCSYVTLVSPPPHDPTNRGPLSWLFSVGYHVKNSCSFPRQ